MQVYETSRVRNVVLLGHSGSGKTTLAETMAYESGMISRRGSIAAGNTISDFHPLEKEKQKSEFSSFISLDWRGHKINLIDTPGSSDFIGEVIAPLKISRNNIFVLDAENGVEVGTEILWNYAREYETTSLIVVNKLDHPNADFDKTVEQAIERFGREVIVVQFPYSTGEDFNAIIDVMKMTMYEFPEGGGKPDKLPIPDSVKAKAELLHNQLVEAIAENDESLMDIFFEKGTLDEEELIDGFKLAMLNNQIYPLFCVCAEKNMGTGRVMGFIDTAIPDPEEGKPSRLIDGSAYKITDKNPKSLLIFRHAYEDHVGDLMYFKVIGGSVKSGDDLYNHRTNSTVRLSTIFTSQGNKRTEVTQLKAGDIGVAVKLKDCISNDTLRDKSLDVEFRKVIYPEPTMRIGVKPLKSGDEEKLGSALHQLAKEDPTLIVDHNAELKQLIISGQGEEHLNRVKYILDQRFKVGVEFLEPRIPYRETITKPVKVQYKHKKQSGGAGQYAEVYLLVEPWTEGMAPPADLNVRNTEEIDLAWGGKLIFNNCIVGGVIDTRFMPAILKGVMDKMENGPLSGCRARDIRVSVFDGSMHSVDSNEAAFKTAALMAFKDAFLKAAPQLLEPIYDLEVFVPAEYMGDVMSDLSTRRGQIMGMDSEGSLQKITARVPLSELNRYTTHLKSMTQGRASHRRTFADYAPVPREIQEKVMKETMALEEE